MPVVNSATTGIKRLVYALMTDELLETYSTVKDAPPLISIKVSPKVETATLYADNKAVETATSMGDISIDIETQDLPLEVQADFLGHALDPLTGTMVYNVDDKPPYMALGYQRTKGNGKSRYVWLYKVKFQEIEEEGKTQEDKVTFQTPKLSGLAIANKNGDWKKVADEDSKGTPIVDFLATVPVSGAPDLIAPTVTTVPIEGAVGVLVGASIIYTFSKAINIADMTISNFFLLKAGVVVPCGLVASVGNTVVTMKPTANMSVGAHVAVCTSDVRSVAGIPLAAIKTTNFTV